SLEQRQAAHRLLLEIPGTARPRGGPPRQGPPPRRTAAGVVRGRAYGDILGHMRNRQLGPGKVLLMRTKTSSRAFICCGEVHEIALGSQQLLEAVFEETVAER